MATGALSLNARRLYIRYERLVRYGVIGAAMAGIYAAITATLFTSGLITDPTWASAVAQALTVPLSFLAHRHVTYADAASDKRQWRRFVAASSCSFAVATGLMKAAVLLHQPFWLAILLNFVAGPCATYAVNALWVFRTKCFWGMQDPLSRPDASEPRRS